MHFLQFVLFGVGGIVIGAVGHAYFAKEAAATKEEVQSWANRLRSAMATDAQAAKVRLEALAQEIEKKL